MTFSVLYFHGDAIYMKVGHHGHHWNGEILLQGRCSLVTWTLEIVTYNR